jgi:cytochrome c peroxidase
MQKHLLALLLITLTGFSYADNALKQQATALFGTLPSKMPGSENDTPALIALGEMLYMDKRLSVNDTQSCNTCHDVTNKGPGVDNLATSPGAFGKNGDRNSPTVWNAGFQKTQFWDGRAEDLVAQAKGPILNPVEMAMPNEAAVEQKLKGISSYQQAFKKAFNKDDAINYNNIAIAIAAFERTLITRDRFDAFINGDDTALNAQEKRGLQSFINTGCAACHNGPTLGGNMYQKLGIVNAYPNQKDQGRFSLTNNAADKMVFKVPMLRNIAKTAPFFHDGSIATLEEAVSQMAWLQVGKKLDASTTADITAFLQSLNHQ